MNDSSLHCAGGSYGRVGQIDLTFGMAHPSAEIPVRGGQRSLPLGQNAHVAPEAGTAGRRADDASGLNKDIEKPLFEGLPVDLLGGRDNNEPHIRSNLFSLKDLGRDPEVIETTIGAGANDDLIDLDPSNFLDILYIGRNVGKGDLGTNLQASNSLMSA